MNFPPIGYQSPSGDTPSLQQQKAVLHECVQAENKLLALFAKAQSQLGNTREGDVALVDELRANERVVPHLTDAIESIARLAQERRTKKGSMYKPQREKAQKTLVTLVQSVTQTKFEHEARLAQVEGKMTSATLDPTNVQLGQPSQKQLEEAQRRELEAMREQQRNRWKQTREQQGQSIEARGQKRKAGDEGSLEREARQEAVAELQPDSHDPLLGARREQQAAVAARREEGAAAQRDQLQAHQTTQRRRFYSIPRMVGRAASQAVTTARQVGNVARRAIGWLGQGTRLRVYAPAALGVLYHRWPINVSTLVSEPNTPAALLAIGIDTVWRAVLYAEVTRGLGSISRPSIQ